MATNERFHNMQLFHEMKQTFPSIPENVINECIKKNLGDRDICFKILSQQTSDPFYKLNHSVVVSKWPPPPKSEATYLPLLAHQEISRNSYPSPGYYTPQNSPNMHYHGRVSDPGVNRPYTFSPPNASSSAQTAPAGQANQNPFDVRAVYGGRPHSPYPPPVPPVGVYPPFTPNRTPPARPNYSANRVHWNTPPSGSPNELKISVSPSNGGYELFPSSHSPTNRPPLFQPPERNIWNTPTLQPQLPGHANSSIHSHYPPMYEPPPKSQPFHFQSTVKVEQPSREQILQDDKAYTQALLLHQRARLEQLGNELHRMNEYRAFLRQDVYGQEQKASSRKVQNARINAEESKKLHEEITKLRVECHFLSMEVDRHTKEIPLGVTDEDFYRNIFTGQAASVGASAALAAATAVTAAVLTPAIQSPKTSLSGASPGQPPASPQPPHLQEEEEDEERCKWKCPKCTFANHPALNKCEICEAERNTFESGRLRGLEVVRQVPCYCHGLIGPH